jgi:hypothetical protein
MEGQSMNRGTDARLRKLEVANGPPRVRMVWSNSSDADEWDRRIADMIASGKARPEDEFLRIGWLPPCAACHLAHI